jgi:molybdopterin adenylyltransferase
MKKIFRVAVLTISDKCSQGLREDRSGKYIVDFFKERDWKISEYEVIPDELELIKGRLEDICDKKKADLLITTGGTGLSPRDVTPEATRSVIEKEVPGFSELLRAEGQKKTPRAILSRGISGIRKTTLIINLAGSIKAVKEGLEMIYRPIPHAIDILSGKTGECGQD